MPETVPARVTHRELKIVIHESFPAAMRPRLGALARDVLRVTVRRFGGAPPPGDRTIYVYRGSGYKTAQEPPFIETVPDGTGGESVARAGPEEERYEVALKLEDLSHNSYFFEQSVYQLGHELGHLLLEPRRSNAVLEILAVASSLEALTEMAQLWIANRATEWRRDVDAVKLRAYRQLMIREQLEKLPPAVKAAAAGRDWTRVADHLRSTRAEHDREPCNWALCHLGAMLFLAEKPEWAALRGVGAMTHPPVEDIPRLQSNAPFDYARLPEAVIAVLRRLGRDSAEAS